MDVLPEDTMPLAALSIGQAKTLICGLITECITGLPSQTHARLERKERLTTEEAIDYLTDCASNDQRAALIASLEAGRLNIDALPEVAARLPKLTEWAAFWRGVTGNNEPASIPLNREAKIAIFKCLQKGYFYLADFETVIATESNTEPFLDLMRAASIAR